jgi:hypothetical protein
VTVARRAVALFVEPQPREPPARAAELDVGVTGLSRGCGASTVARGLAVVLPTAQVADAQWPGRSGVLVVVAGPDGVPVLAGMVTDRLRERLPHVVLVANRPPDPDEWLGAGAVCVPHSRLGVYLLSRGRRPWGRFHTALRELAHTVREVSPR